MSLGQLSVIRAYFISQCLKMESFKKTNSNKWLLRFKSILLYKQEK